MTEQQQAAMLKGKKALEMCRATIRNNQEQLNTFYAPYPYFFQDMDLAIEALKQALKHSPQRTWVGLTDKDIEQEFGFIDELLRDCVQRTEAKLKEKNT